MSVSWPRLQWRKWGLIGVAALSVTAYNGYRTLKGVESHDRYGAWKVAGFSSAQRAIAEELIDELRADSTLPNQLELQKQDLYQDIVGIIDPDSRYTQLRERYGIPRNVDTVTTHRRILEEGQSRYTALSASDRQAIDSGQQPSPAGLEALLDLKMRGDNICSLDSACVKEKYGLRPELADGEVAKMLDTEYHALENRSSLAAELSAIPAERGIPVPLSAWKMPLPARETELPFPAAYTLLGGIFCAGWYVHRNAKRTGTQSMWSYVRPSVLRHRTAPRYAGGSPR